MSQSYERHELSEKLGLAGLVDHFQRWGLPTDLSDEAENTYDEVIITSARGSREVIQHLFRGILFEDDRARCLSRKVH